MGTITFAGTTYPLPNSVSVQGGSYSATANPPAGYVFSYWQTSGGVQVSTYSLQSVAVYVTGTGTLNAVFAPAPSFGISGPSSMTMAVGGSETVTIIVTSYNQFSGSVSLSLVWNNGRPSWVSQDSFSPNPVSVSSGGSTTSTLTVAVSSSALPGTYSTTVSGSSGSLTTQLSIQIIVQTPPLSVGAVSPANSATVSSLPVTFQVQITSGGSPIQGASVLFYLDSASTGSATSDSSGYAQYSLQSISTGTHTWYVTASKSGYLSATSSTWSFTYTSSSYSVSLTSSTTDSKSNVGTITFAGTTYPLPSSASVQGGSYGATANPPAGYIFSSWSTTGGVQVSAYNLQSVLVTVTGGGTLNAMFAPAPSFGISGPASLTATAGGGATAAITVTSYNQFSGSVSLSVVWNSGRPSWVTQDSLNPNPVSMSSGGSITSTLTIAVSSSAPPGTYSISVVGSSSSGPMSQQANIQVTVQAPSPASYTVSLASSTTDGKSNVGTMTFAGTTYTLPNSFSVQGGSYSATANPPAGYVFSYWQMSGGVQVSSYNLQSMSVTVTGSGGLSAVFTPSPSFTISAPSSMTVVVGSSVTATIAVTSYNQFSGSVSLSAVWPNGRPSWVTQDNFGPNPVSVSSGGSATSTLTLAVSSSATPGTYSIAIVGASSSGSMSQQSNIQITVQAPSLTATASGTPTSGTAPLTIQFAGSAFGGIPPYTYSWTFGDGTTNTSQNPSHTYPTAGSYTATLTVTDSTGTHATSSVAVVVNPATTYLVSLSSSTTDGNTNVGSITLSGTTYILPNSASFQGGSYSATANAPAGYIFSSWSTTGGVQVSAYNLQSVSVTVTGSGTLNALFAPAPSFGISSAASLTVIAGRSTTAIITVTSYNQFSGFVSLSVVWNSGRPSWVTQDSLSPHSVSVSSSGSTTSTLTIAVSSSAALGTYSINVVGSSSSGSMSQPASIQVIVSASTTSTTTGVGFPTWHGSYITTYFSNLPWHHKVVEIHISAYDALSSGTLSYVLAVQTLANGGEQVSEVVPVGSELFGWVFKQIGSAVAGNPGGSFDFTAIEVADGIGWLYGGSLSAGTLVPGGTWGIAISYYPIPITLFNLGTPYTYRLYYTNDLFTGLISSVLAITYNTVSIYDPEGRLYLTVVDSQGRMTGLNASSNQPVSQIPGSSYFEFGHDMAVILPGNVTTFSYSVDARQASQAMENYTLSVSSIYDGTTQNAQSRQLAIGTGQMQNATITITKTTSLESTVTSTQSNNSQLAPSFNEYVPYLIIAIAIVIAGALIAHGLTRRPRERNTRSP